MLYVTPMLQAAARRETRRRRPGSQVSRHRRDSAEQILDWARPRLAADPYAGGDVGRRVPDHHAVYFDTSDFAVYRRRGSYRRPSTGSAGTAMPTSSSWSASCGRRRLLSKRRTVACPGGSRPAVAELFADPDWPGFWFGRRLRDATAGTGLPGGLPSARTRGHGRRSDRCDSRSTTTSRAQPCTHFGFDAPHGIPVLGPARIVEMKFCVKMPPFSTNLVDRVRSDARRHFQVPPVARGPADSGAREQA